MKIAEALKDLKAGEIIICKSKGAICRVVEIYRLEPRRYAVQTNAGSFGNFESAAAVLKMLGNFKGCDWTAFDYSVY